MVAHSGHDMPSMETDSTTSASSSSMSMMTMAFFTSTDTPLYSSSWTPTSAGAYAGTCIFLIILAIILRAIFTLKAFLEARAIESALKRRYVVVEGENGGLADKVASDANSTTGILTTNGVAENVRLVQAPVKRIQPWRFSVDLPRALVMTVAAGIGYLL
jgi:solute carrier family 31 (copper transporter), member 1